MNAYRDLCLVYSRKRYPLTHFLSTKKQHRTHLISPTKKQKDEWDEGQPDIETELRELLRINTHAKFDDFQFDFMHLNSKERRACDNVTEALKRREALLSELTDPQGFSIGMGQVQHTHTHTHTHTPQQHSHQH